MVLLPPSCKGAFFTSIYFSHLSFFINLNVICLICSALLQSMEDPLLGKQKKGDLLFLRVHQFKMVKQLTLLGYSYEDGTVILELMALGSHENFHRDVKRFY